MTKLKLSLCMGLIFTLVAGGISDTKKVADTQAFFLPSSVFSSGKKQAETNKITIIDEDDEEVEYSFAIVDFFKSIFD